MLADTEDPVTYYVGVKYKSNTIAGLVIPNPNLVTYDFTTSLNEGGGLVIVDTALDPKLVLKPK